MSSTLTLGIKVPLSKVIIYLTAWTIVCCLVVGIAELQIRQHTIVPTLFLFTNRLLLGNSWHKLFVKTNDHEQSIIKRAPETAVSRLLELVL